MTFKEQWKKIQDNWIIALLIVLVVIVPYFSGTTSSYLKTGGFGEVSELSYAPERMGRYYPPSYPPSYEQDFAPDVQERKITKSANLNTQVETGTFAQTETQLKSILSGQSSRYAPPILLNENVNKYDSGRRSYYSGSYTIKVDVRAYDGVIAQLKEIGEMQSFSEDAEDITGRYTNIQTELSAEKARLGRYEQMLAEAELIAYKIELSDRIFNQERTIKYLEDSLQNQDIQVEYATIYMQITEKQSEFASIAFVGFGELISGLVSSTSGLLEFLFVILPWAVAITIIWLGVRWVRRR